MTFDLFYVHSNQVEDKSELMRMVVVDEMTNRGDRLVRISESSVDSMEDMELEEESVEVITTLK